jgi:hypothetical protein
VRVRFYIDPVTGVPHIYKHDVNETEVEEALANVNEDRPGKRHARVAIGRTEAGRILRITYVRDPQPDSIFVITAYDLKGKPLVAFRRLRKKHR